MPKCVYVGNRQGGAVVQRLEISWELECATAICLQRLCNKYLYFIVLHTVAVKVMIF